MTLPTNDRSAAWPAVLTPAQGSSYFFAQAAMLANQRPVVASAIIAALKLGLAVGQHSSTSRGMPR